MKRLLVLAVVSTLVVGLAGCQQCNWFKRPSSAACSPSAMPAATYAVPGAAASGAPGCNSCG